jgi:hypothetical protein
MKVDVTGLILASHYMDGRETGQMVRKEVDW